jgi:hypothetical protein
MAGEWLPRDPGGTGSAAATPNRGFGADPRVVEVDFHEAMQDQRRQAGYRRRLLKGGHALGHGHRADLVEGSEQAYPIAERAPPSRIAKQIAGIGQSEPGPDFSFEQNLAPMAGLGCGLIDPVRTSLPFARLNSVEEDGAVPSYDLKVRYMTLAPAPEKGW